VKEIVKYHYCFVCGDRNLEGLKARFFFDGEQAVSDVVAVDRFEGYRGIYHGGIISALLDEVMIKAILARNVFAVTAEITVRFHCPVETGTRLRFLGRITEQRGRLYLTEGEARSPDGASYASATGKYIEARPDLKARLMSSLDDE
jgi:acyl-coenzyme A thioesterase PaaI-like protein